MIVKCNECGLVLKKCLSLGCVCPECGSSFWHRLDVPTMMEVTMKERIEDKLTDKEIKYMASITKREKKLQEEGLAFEIFDVFNNKKVNVRKIYVDGHTEGFEGNPLVVNHIFPKMQALKYFAQNMNEEYRDLMRKFILSDFYPMEVVNELYQKFKETIEKL